MYKVLKYLLLILVVGSVTAAPTPDRYLIAEWNPNTKFTDGYNFYCSTTVGDFSTPALDVPGITSNTINLPDLWCMSQSDGDYFLAVTAYWTDQDGKLKESGAQSWVPVKISGGKIPVSGIPDAPGGLRLR